MFIDDIKMKKKQNEKLINLKGVRVHNLKNINVSLPANKLVVVTGLSGSGKSSLVFDTLYAEGQRRYVESLSSYARQFLGRMSKPEVDFMDGIAPAIAIEQKTVNRNPRSTVGTSTEIYEYIKLLFARIGRIYSPISGNEVKRHSVSNVADFIMSLPEASKVFILAPLLPRENMPLNTYFDLLGQMGFSRLYNKGELIRLDDMERVKKGDLKEDIYLLVDRLVIKKEEDSLYSRIFDSVQTAFNEGDAKCFVEVFSGEEKQLYDFSNRLEMDGITFVKPSVNFFSFNNPYGACKTCGGLGSIVGISEDLVIPNPNLSVYEDTVACWRGEKMSEWKHAFIAHAEKEKFPIHKPYKDLSAEQKKLLWDGTKKVEGIYACFRFMDEQSYKIQYRVLSARYKGKTHCPECNGTRLRGDAAYVKVDGKSIHDLVQMPIEKLLVFFENIQLNEYEKGVSERILTEIIHRLRVLVHVGLPYISLQRHSASLSGGEAQRIHLATSLGSALVGSMYILDEPSIGLHSRDTEKLLKVIKDLRDLGNSVIVVEHDEETILAADQIIDIGPLAGQHGGELVFQGSPKELIDGGKSLTADYLCGRRKIELPKQRRKWKNYIELQGASQHNLQNVSVKIPLQVLTVVSGVSGSGKTTLIRQTLYPALKKMYEGYGGDIGKYERLTGDTKKIQQVELVDQNPIGRSSRSNPATYIKAFDDIRALFASLKLAKLRGYKPGFFSFNVEGGRCDACEGEGTIKVEMQFMADVYLECEQCKGRRFKDEVLDIQYNGKSISDVLDLTVEEAISFFSEDTQSSDAKHIVEKLKTLEEVGLGYLHLGQSSNSLSGGEAQRVKLAYFLSKGASEKPTLFIFDEPTTGLHFHDINKLKKAFDALIAKGHTLLVIEHHLDIIKLADWLIDMGPEGGEKGGMILFEGVPEDLIKNKKSYTAKYLKEKLKCE